MSAPRVLLLPGWQNSGADHWQSHWQTLYGDARVEQDDWQWPRRGDWMARLEETLLALPPEPAAVLVAHSLGCHLVSAWAAHSQYTSRVCAALLVAPPDLERPDLPPQLAAWRNTPRPRLPFASQLVFSEDDPYCAQVSSRDMAAAWGAQALSLGARGHLNASSDLGAWPEGRALLQSLTSPLN